MILIIIKKTGKPKDLYRFFLRFPKIQLARRYMAITFLESIGITPQIEEKISKIWKEKNLELELSIIDLQHLWLIFLLVEAEETLNKNEKNEEFQKVSVELINFTTEHFSLEEKLLIEFNYPEYAYHKKQHQDFVELMKQKFNATFIKEHFVEKELVNFLWKWLSEHILYEDTKYKNFLESKQIKIDEWFKSLIDEHQVTIDKAQLELYNKITQTTQIKEIVTENLFSSINNIWHVYNLSTGIPIVDLQHLWLIQMTVELDYACKNLNSTKREQVFRSIIKGAIQYTKDHFSIEEKIMEKFHYHNYASHVKQHQGFLEFVQRRYTEFQEGNIQAAPNLVMDLKEWLLGHIAIQDKNIGSSLKEFHGDIIIYTREILKQENLKIKKKQMDLYNKVMGIVTF